MIHLKILRNDKGAMYGFEAKNHGKSLVCAGVSALTINAVNSVKQFTDEEFTCEAPDEGGYLYFILPRIKSGAKNESAELLLQSMLLGIRNISGQYPKQIIIEDTE